MKYLKIYLVMVFVTVISVNAQVLISEAENLDAGTIHTISISNDDSQLLTLAADRKALLWDLGSMNKIKSFKDAEGLNTALFHKRSSVLLTAGNSDRIVLWDRLSQKPASVFKPVESIIEIVSSSTNGMLYGSTLRGKILIWNDAGKQVREIAVCKGPVKKILISQNAQIMLVVSEKEEISLWNLSNYSKTTDLELSKAQISAVAIDPEGKRILVAYKSGKLCAFNEAGIKTREISSASFIRALLFTADGKECIAGFDNGAVTVYEIDTWVEVLNFEAHEKSISALSLSYKGDRLVSSGEDARIKIWDMASMEFAESKEFINPVNEPAENYLALSVDRLSGSENVAESQGDETFGKYFGLIMGVDNYIDPGIVDLDEPVNDARRLADILLRNYTFEPENMIRLTDPSREEILNALEMLSEVITPQDNLLIFFAGHGVWDEKIKTGYWLPSDAKKSSTSNWFRNSTLRDYVAGIDSRHTLVIADACFSGAIFKTRSLSDTPETQSGFSARKLHKLPSRKAMTSGTLKSVPDKSVFMAYLTKRLEDNENLYVSSEELFSSLRTAVINNSPNIPQFGDIMNAGDEGGDFIFIRRR